MKAVFYVVIFSAAAAATTIAAIATIARVLIRLFQLLHLSITLIIVGITT